ncbi:MAG TPA: glycosyltransferase [Candidatus Nitrosocosmicus sp.]|nr:glycosyltransferase [Candidatus Nitrosocosmicus sp.]
MKKNLISTVIPVYKNTEQFLKLLKNNYPYIQDTEIIIVDDASGENLKDILNKQFPKIIVLENKTNQGFACSVNNGVSHASGDIILLLNSDVKLLDDSYKAVVNNFENQQLFAISFLQIEKDNSYIGKNKTYFKRGLFFHKKAENLNKGINGWAEGGSCLLRKNYFTELKGFDDLYKPFYWEDIDLSYRAYKKGWVILFSPDVKVEHHHESTIGKYNSSEKIKIISYKNQILFMWKNLDGSKLFLHLLWLPYNIIFFLMKGEINFLKGLYMAIGQLRQIKRI